MTKNRYELLDIIKLVSCLLILLHHWAIYVYQPNTNSINFLILFLSKTRYVTAIFFSISGFLFYEKWYHFKKNEHINFKKEFLKVFHSLAPAYYFAIFLSLCAMVFVNFISNNTTFSLPSFKEWFCNLFMLQDILHETSISAGLWYVIIHLQNAAISLIILKYCRLRFPKKNELISIFSFFTLWFISAFYFNRNINFDNNFLYFFSSYGLGLLAGFSLRKNSHFWIIVSFLTIIALQIEFRPRLFISYTLSSVIMIYFLYLKKFPLRINTYTQQLAQQILYLFLFHYPILIALNGIPLPPSALKACLVLIGTIVLDLWLSNKFFSYFQGISNDKRH